MLANAFIGRKEKPGEKELVDALGSARRLWDGLVGDLASEHGVSGREWKSYSAKAGWSLRLLRGERVIVYLSPGLGSFLASFALGDKAVQAALRAKLPAGIVKLVKDAKRYAEGTAVRIEVKKNQDVEAVKTLAAIKLEF